MSKDDKIRMRHRLDAATEALELAAHKTREDIEHERMLHLSLVRLIEIIGEAASQVTPSFRSTQPEIPWKEIIGMRNHLIHGYDNIDFDILYQTIQEDIPSLVASLENYLNPDTI